MAAILVARLGAHSRAAADQDMFHLPVIQQFIRELPHPDLSDYASSTTPGYHLIVAAFGRCFGENVTILRLAGSIFTVGLLVTLGACVGSKSDVKTAIVLCLPMTASIYVFSAGAFLLPDNAGWWGVLIVLLIALRPRVDLVTYVGGCASLFATVWMRQIHLWAAAPLVVATVLGSARDPNDPFDPQFNGSTAMRVGKIFLACLPAILTLAYFHHLWHGLVPPNQRTMTTGGNPSAPAVILALFAIIGLFFIGYFWKRPNGNVLLGGAIMGFIAGAFPRTSYNTDARRFSGIWNAVKFLHESPRGPHLPYLFDRSALMILLATAGGAIAAAWLSVLPVRQRWIWCTAIAAFIAAQTVSANPWQRYYEPFVLMAAALSAADVGQNRDVDPPPWAKFGPLLLTAMLALVAALSLR